ncbi:MAG: hypothetical protein IKS00_02540 [Bacteroidales bacterium]|nr:hypothetical protein [Bacteroidales bacterium]
MQNVSAGPDQHLCGGTAVLSATIASNGEVGTWSEPTGRVTFDDPHKNNTIVRGIPNGESVSLTWTVTRDEKIVGEDYVFIFNEKPIVLFTQGRQDNQETKQQSIHHYGCGFECRRNYCLADNLQHQIRQLYFGRLNGGS